MSEVPLYLGRRVAPPLPNVARRHQILLLVAVQAFHPGGNPGANLKSISHRCHPILVEFVWELTQENIDLLLGCLTPCQDTALHLRPSRRRAS